MQNLKIRLDNDEQIEEIDNIAGQVGLNIVGIEIEKKPDVLKWVFLSKNKTHNGKPSKEITLPELRAIVNTVNEYLEPLPNGEYKYHSNVSLVGGEWIEIPGGAEIAILYKTGEVEFFKENYAYFWFAKFQEWKSTKNAPNFYKNASVVWQREQDEPFLTPECTLNDQYAEIEQVRQAEIHGTVKAKPDFNFGAAQASGGAKMRENNHYFIDVSDVDEVDFYEIAKRYNVTDPAIQHILKKCLAIGNRGHKNLETDLKDILKTAKRALQINGFGE